VRGARGNSRPYRDFVDSTPRAYRLKASNAAPPISTFAGAIPGEDRGGMTGRDSEPSRMILLSMQALRWRALAEIRQQPGCSSVQDIAINLVTDERAVNNWSLCAVRGHC
jgi:hypothetical protein